MLLHSLMASSQSGCFPGLVLHQEQGISKSFKDLPHLLPSIGLRQEVLRSSVSSWAPYDHDYLFKSTNKISEYSRFVKAAPVRRTSLLGDAQDKQADYILFSFGIDEQLTKHKKLLQYLMSGAVELEKLFLDSSTFPDVLGIQTTPAEMHRLRLAGTQFKFNNFSESNTSLLDSDGNYYDLQFNSDKIHDIPPSTALLHADGRLSFVGNIIDMKDLVSVLEEYRYTKDPAWRKQVIVPEFRWNDAINLQDHTCASSLKIDSLAVAPPQRSHEKVKVRRSSKKTRKAWDRTLYKNNSIQACEMLLSIMMDKKRTVKSVTNSLKKAGPKLPLLLTQFSASITGTGLAVMLSVILKVACGSIALHTPSVLTSGICVGLFWLSSAVNQLRDTIIYISKSSKKLEVEEEKLMTRVDKSVNNIFFRAAALIAVLILRFA